MPGHQEREGVSFARIFGDPARFEASAAIPNPPVAQRSPNADPPAVAPGSAAANLGGDLAHNRFGEVKVTVTVNEDDGLADPDDDGFASDGEDFSGLPESNETQDAASGILMFELGGMKLGIPASCVLEILRAVALTAVPSRNSRIEGVIDLRGEILPVLNLRACLGFPPKSVALSDHLIVLQENPPQDVRDDARKDVRLVVRVDRVWDFLNTPPESTAVPGPEMSAAGVIRTLSSYGENIIAILDSDMIFQLYHKIDL